MSTPGDVLAEWGALRRRNTEREARLARQGVVVGAIDVTVRQTWLEHILWHVGGGEDGGDLAVAKCRLANQERIAEALDAAESQVARAKLLAPHNGR